MNNKTTPPTPELPRHQNILQETGAAAGRINGINHLVMFTHDMNEGIHFYRDLLGLRIVRTQRFKTTGDGLRSAAKHSSGSAISQTAPSAVSVEIELRQVFFEMGNGELFSLYEAPGVADNPAAPVSSLLWPDVIKSRWSQPTSPQKVDHLSFDVSSHEDVLWFRTFLIANGVAVSDVSERRGINNTHRFISSIYFVDPSGNPLEISSFDACDSAWQAYDFTDWFMDEQPVDALLNSTDQRPNKHKPRWLKSPTR